jgi:hypothetical protein
MGIFRDLTGQQFGRLTVVGVGPRRGKKNRITWDCLCACGGRRSVYSEKLHSGETQSCGCLQRERTGDANRKHGGKGTRLYRVWKNMTSRCRNPHLPVNRGYAGRGIAVCARWSDFANFRADMGEPPSPKHSIDRIDNDGNYEPGNCRWALPVTQARNHRRNRLLTHEGVTLPLSAWAERAGIPAPTLLARIDRLGWPVSLAIRTPVNAARGKGALRRLLSGERDSTPDNGAS